MKRKIKLTESQYDKLKNNLLLETEDVSVTLEYVEVGDILIFKGDKFNVKIKVIKINPSNGDIEGQIMVKQQPIKVMFRYDSYNEVQHKFTYTIFDENGKNPTNEVFIVHSLDIERNGQIVEIPGDASQAHTTGKKTQPKNNTDAISKPIDLSTQTTEKKPDEVNKEKLKQYYKEIMNDQTLRKAFYKAPSFWNYFTAALKGEPARGSGLGPAFDMIDRYRSKDIDSKTPGFSDKQGKKAKFYLPYRVSLNYETKSQKSGNINIEAGAHEASVKKYKIGENNRILVNSEEYFKIVVKGAVKGIKDTYYCDIYVFKPKVKTTNPEKNIKIKFEGSDGYTEQNDEKTTNN